MKNSEQKKLDQILKDNLSEGTAQVPDFVWDRIEEELFPEKRRRGFFWWFFGGLCLLLIGGLIVIAVSGQEVHSQNYTSLKAKLTSNNYQDQTNKNPALTKNQKVNNIFQYAIKPKSGSRYRKFANLIAKPGYVPDYNQKSGGKSTTYFKLKKDSKHRVYTAVDSKKGIHPSKINYNGLHSQAVSRNNDHLSPSVNNSDSIPPFNSENQPEEKESKEPKDETTKTGKWNLAELLKLVKRDFPEKPVEQKVENRPSFLSIGIFGGPSLYHSAVFKDYFTSGQLSKRMFASSGFELGLQARLRISDRFKIYAGLTFNQKQTQFRYNVAITEADYFTYIENGEKVPLENIHDDGMNSCFLAKDVTAEYQIKTVSLSIGTNFEFLRIGKFSAAADLRLSGNIHSSLNLREMLVLDIAQPPSETFSYLQPGAGLLLNFRLNERISLGLAPFFSKQFYLKESFSRKLDELVIPLSISFDL